MSASKSIPSQTPSSSSSLMYRYANGIEVSEDQWSPDTTDAHGEPTPLQWTTLPQHNMAPVSHNGTSASYNVPKFSHPGITSPIDLDNPSSFNPGNAQIVNGYIANNQRIVYQPNGSAIILPSTQSSAILSGRTWMTPVSSTSQHLTRGPSWPVTRTNTTKKPKRIRTAFTSQQMMELEQEYARTRYLDRSRRIELAKILHLNERTIKIWFQNQRMKEKKDRAESMEDSEETMESSPENAPMPIMTQQDYPTPVADAMFKQETMYMDHYPETPTPMPPPNMLPQTHNMESHMINGYPIYEYPHDQHLAFEYRQMQLQEAPVYVSEMQEMSPQFREESPRYEEQAVQPETDVHSTDISWIRDIYPEEES